MDIKEKVIQEWFFRLPKGYAEPPYSSEEMRIFRQVLSEHVNESPDILDQGFLEAEPVKEEIDTTLPVDEKIEIIRQTLDSEVGLEDVLIKKVIDIYSNFSPAEQKQFDKVFRSFTVEGFVSADPAILRNFHDVSFDAKVAGGLGRGEVQILLAVNNSTTGGTAKKDIVVPGGEWEVKELDKQSFRPAKAGRAFNFELTKDIIDFYDDIVKPYTTMSDPKSALKDMVAEKSYDSIDDLITAMEKFAPGGEYDENKIQSAYEWPDVAFFSNWYEGFQELNKIIDDIKDDIKDTRITVQGAGDSQAYWISPESAREIEDGAGSDNDVVINIGTKITEVSSNKKIWFNRLKRFDYVRRPDELIDQLVDIRNSFFDGILGLIYFKKGEGGKPYIGTAEDFVVYAVSQGQYRYRIKDHSSVSKRSFLTKQLRN
jgi:hypothetical protein